MLAGEGQAKRWIKPAQWEHPERDLEKQMPEFGQSTRTLAGNLQMLGKVIKEV